MTNKNKLVQLELILEHVSKDSYIEKVEKPAWMFENGKRLSELGTQIKEMDSAWKKGELNPDDFQELWIPAAKVHEVFTKMLSIIRDNTI